MPSKQAVIKKERIEIQSAFLHRTVIADIFWPPPVKNAASLRLLLINDGQDMDRLALEDMLQYLYTRKEISALLCVAIHAADRMTEYGIAGQADYKGRGGKAELYARFILEELIPFMRSACNIPDFKEKSMAGFSMGGLSALDIVWKHPKEFTRAGIFSGSLWWRSKGMSEGYDDEKDKIMHAHIRKGKYAPRLRFFFEAGTMDETSDRNNNGIIDSIDDTLTLIDELVKKGYDREKKIRYIEIEGGRHDVETWARAMPEFLKWGWGR
jgi:enterochelin esterase-like enzyme